MIIVNAVIRTVVLASAFVAASPWLWGAGALPPAPVDTYPLHEDGGLIYDPQRREAERTGQLARYEGVAATRRELALGPYRLQCRVPRRAQAYDVVPIPYELSWNAKDSTFPVAVEAVAFEDKARRRGRDCFDLALPGRIDLAIEYLGSITAHLKPGARHNLTPDLSDRPREYPPFTRKPFVRSGVVEAGDLVWFKFRYTNTGTTILDPEGFGGCQFVPELCRKNARGAYETIGRPYNLYVRDLAYLYPGESHEAWVHFQTRVPGETPQNFGLSSGEYLLRLRVTYRCYRTPDPFLNIWEGPVAFCWEMPFVVASKPRQAPVPPGRTVLTDSGGNEKLPGFIHTLEEFMTAFDCHGARPKGDTRRISGTLHLQVAPWTKHVIVKLITTPPVALATAAAPVAVDVESLAVTFNPRPPHCLLRNGLRVPIIASQTMADMRTNVQIGPFPERHILRRLHEMQECGINLVATTGMPWLYDDRHRPPSNYQGDALKYFLELARHEGLCVEGWGTYPYDRATTRDIAAWITGKPFKLHTHMIHGYRALSHADPLIAAANAAVWLYQFRRWGDLYYQNETGEVPIGVEDTRGWMRQDVNVRLPMGDLTVRAFRAWLKERYGTIEAVNAAWGSAFGSFDAIDPEQHQVRNRFGHLWEYIKPEHPFHDWNAAVGDLDAFRTELRIRNYRDTLTVVRRQIPTATICLRTEGGNVIVSGIDPRDPNPHLRHVFYSQRRCALVAEIIQRSGLVTRHADYTTVPYTPSELRRLVRMAVRQGIVPMYFPQFDNMRDMAINARYGTDYRIHYNLSEPKKGYMMHVLTALYPWFVVTYEEGGVPGILWEDYQCDGFATETQKREMHLFRRKLEAALTTPEAMRLRAAEVTAPSPQWRSGARGVRSYTIGGRTAAGE